MINGKSADTALKIAGVLLIMLFASYTAIVISGKPVPQEFQSYGNILIGALVGFIAGSRVVTPDVSAQIKTEPLNNAEKEVLTHGT